MRFRFTLAGTALAAALIMSVAIVPSQAAPASPQAATATRAAAAPGPPTPTDVVAPNQRAKVLPSGWQKSTDLSWTTSGDATGFHLLVAEAKTGYAWRTVATLSEPGIDTDQWVGNACLTGSGRRVVVVYAPRNFTNRDNLFGRGGFVAVVDLTSGAVTKLNVGASLAYYDPGCGAGETAVLTQAGEIDLGKTRLNTLDVARGVITRRQDLAGQVTSAIPVGNDIVAANGNRLFDLSPAGAQRTLATTRGVAFDVHPDAAGGVTYLDRPDDSTSAVNSLSLKGGRPRELARGPLTEVGLAAGAGGRTFLTGRASAPVKPPAGMRRLTVDAHAEISSQGGLALTRVGPAAVSAAITGSAPSAGDNPSPVSLKAIVPATGRSVQFKITPGAAMTPARVAEGNRPSPVRPLAATLATKNSTRTSTKATAKSAQVARTAVAAVADSPTDPVDADATCAVARNDVKIQVKQPHWNQVEWAADLAVTGNLTMRRPANWGKSGLSSWVPQAMFPNIPLKGTTAHVPASIMLGILAQESNLDQASWHILEGETGNPLIGNYYGTSGWSINWANSDCGYGVAQVTDGMRKTGGNLSAPQQRAVAMDYATNIAAGVRILEEKWNQTQTFSQINNNDPTKIENWFAAVWAYNSGVNPQAVTGNTTGCTPGPSCADSRGNWGLGWGNNPANPDYSYNRRPFLNGVNGEGSQADAARPQQWPYPEKVMGWAAFPIVKSDFRNPGTYAAGYTQAWWTDNIYRTQVKPPLPTFCSTASATNDNCTVSGTTGKGACGYSDFHCWWHWNATWKPNCQTTDSQGNVVYTCGYDNSRYSPGSAEPADGTQYPPECTTAGLPSGALIVDDQPDSYTPVRSGCNTPTTNSGSFGLQFAGTSAGLYPSKIDFHQAGGGLDAHFWFAHAYTNEHATTNSLKVTGTWTLSHQWYNIWGRVLVHVPDHGGGSQQAAYVVDTGSANTTNRYRTRMVNTKSRFVDSSHDGGHWADLGVFNFAGTPAVSLSNITRDGNGSQDIPYDAVAFQSLPSKPKDFVVAMGDSYSSGEGAGNYYPETNADGTDDTARNGCHRSPNAWIRKTALADQAGTTLGSRADNWDNNLDFQLLACSGAETENMLPLAGPKNAWNDSGESAFTSSEIAQLDAGYLDENTTLVTLSIGGNDARFGPIVQYCLQNEPSVDCQTTKLWLDSSESDILSVQAPQLINTKVKDSITTVLGEIHRQAPNAKIVLMGYPRLIDNVGCLQGPTTPPDVRVYLTTSEGNWMNSMADVLDPAMLESTRQFGNFLQFADPRTDFAGAGACATQNAGIKGVDLGLTPGERPVTTIHPLRTWGPSQQSFHPNTYGTTLYAGTLTRTLRTMGL